MSSRRHTPATTRERRGWLLIDRIIVKQKLNLSPASQQIVINASQLHACSVSRNFHCKPLNRGVEIEQQRPVAIAADHALDPEEGGDARSSGHWLYTIEYLFPFRKQ